MNIFQNESGAILGKDNEILHILKGSSGSVEFPGEMILELHRFSKGIVKCLSHVHPTYMNEYSLRDDKTLRTLAVSLHPFPISLEVIAETLEQSERFTKVPYIPFTITTYFAQLESRESWEERNKTSPREVSIYKLPRKEIIFFPESPREEYWDLLIRISYDIF